MAEAVALTVAEAVALAVVTDATEPFGQFTVAEPVAEAVAETVWVELKVTGTDGQLTLAWN